ASVKRLFRIRLLLQKVEQTLHQNEGSFGGQVTSDALTQSFRFHQGVMPLLLGGPVVRALSLHVIASVRDHSVELSQDRVVFPGEGNPRSIPDVDLKELLPEGLRDILRKPAAESQDTIRSWINMFDLGGYGHLCVSPRVSSCVS
ncbi:hypothetical protein, partial [Roseobacter denitrificans]|uniref:hypothetical protein n=1 Tax=Roseobacter denitrificans TaxID=2434 RepID=UPI001C0CD929